MSKVDKGWKKVFKGCDIKSYDFKNNPFERKAKELRSIAKQSPRILCWQPFEKNRPQVFVENDLFVLPTKNGTYRVLRGEGYVEIPDINEEVTYHSYNLPFSFDSAKIGDSEMQHLDFAYTTGMLQRFVFGANDNQPLRLTIRGRKFTAGKFLFKLKGWEKEEYITVKGVQTEVDGGYESKKLIVLVEAKNPKKDKKTDNVIIRQLYYPFRQWDDHTEKTILTLFFERRNDEYHFWEFEFKNKYNYNSICLKKSKRYKICY